MLLQYFWLLSTTVCKKFNIEAKIVTVSYPLPTYTRPICVEHARCYTLLSARDIQSDFLMEPKEVSEKYRFFFKYSSDKYKKKSIVNAALPQY